MKYVSLPDDTPHLLPFYLTMEEYVARNFDCGDLFFMWQVEPTVIFGRNQLIETEVNVDYCRKNDIRMYRRKSGGGCVYADMSNIMLSYITESDNVEATFSRYTSMIADMLKTMGLNASKSSRNDILIDGQKVSGSAFYLIPKRSIAHGTMLYDTDMTHITNAITPSEKKLESKGVSSVRSRITTIRQHSDISIDEFKHKMRHHLCGNEELRLSKADVAAIEAMSEPYYSDEWIFGKNPGGISSRIRHIENVGEFRVDIETSGGVIKSVDMTGDFFILSDTAPLFDKLKGVKYTPHDISEALDVIDPSKTILGLTKDILVNLLF